MSKLGHGFKPAFDHVCGQRDRVIGFPLLIFFPRAETVFTPSARIPSQSAGAQQLRENPKLRLLCKPPFIRPDLLLHKILWSAFGIVKFVFLALYFAILTTERVISLVVCFTGGFSGSDTLDYYMITLTILSIVCAYIFAAVQIVKYKKTEKPFGGLAIASGILLLGGMVHTEGTIPGIQFASYGMILISMAAHTIQSVKEQGNAGVKWLSFAYTVAYSMSIPVVYHTNISLAYLFIPIEIVVSAGMVVLFAIMLKRFYDCGGENSFSPLPMFAALVGDILVLALRWQEEINMFVLIFICVTILLWAAGKVVCARK